jgi:hypothetical protein
MASAKLYLTVIEEHKSPEVEPQVPIIIYQRKIILGPRNFST